LKRGNPNLPLNNHDIRSMHIRHKRDVACEKSELGRIFESESTTGNFDWSTLLNFVLVILGGMIAGITGLLLENYRRKEELRITHLESIKDLCLTPIYQALTRLITEYDLVESKYEATLLEEMLQGRHQWWEGFSLQDTSDKALYHDLANHFKDLPSILKKTEDCISSMTPQYFERVLNLEIEIHQALKKNFQIVSFFRELSTDEKQAYQNLTDEEKRRASFQILRMSVSKSAEEKSDAISEIKRFITSNDKVEVLKKMATEFSNSNNAKEVVNLRRKIDSQISECLNALAEAKLFAKLKGKCKYL
jgi:hypothetical protein